MQLVLIYNLSRPGSLPTRAGWCDSFLCQLRGLTFQKQMISEGGLLLVQKSDSKVEAAIHMLFMWIDLAVVWINSSGKVVDVRLARAWRPAYIPKMPAQYVLELSVNRLHDFEIGELVRIETQAP